MTPNERPRGVLKQKHTWQFTSTCPFSEPLSIFQQKKSMTINYFADIFLNVDIFDAIDLGGSVFAG